MSSEGRVGQWGEITVFTVASEADLERQVLHHELTTIEFVELGLSFESERTADVEMPLSMLLALVHQDMRDNAQQVHSEHSDQVQTQNNLVDFFERLEKLSVTFPWTLKLTCPMSIATIETVSEADVTKTRYEIDPSESERVSAAFAELAFRKADQAEGIDQ